MLHSNATFQALSDVYNQFHNFEDSSIRRKDLNRKRLADAFFLYGLLEMGSRSNVFPVFSTSKHWLDEYILECHNDLEEQFSKTWTENHVCEVYNCERAIVSDGGMKIDRAVCAHKFSMLRRFKHSKKFVLTGCVASPSPDNPFCPKLKNTDFRCIGYYRLSCYGCLCHYRSR